MKSKHGQVFRPPHRCSTQGTGVHRCGTRSLDNPTSTRHAADVPKMEAHVEIINRDTRQQKEFTAFDICAAIPPGGSREARNGRTGGGVQVWTSVLLCVVLTLVLLNDMMTYGRVEDVESEVAEVASYPPLQVVVYYEALCPDSRYFVIKQLKPAYEKLHSIMSVSFVPYGKAQTTEKDGKYTFVCQHGPVECRANTVHACMTNAIRDETKQLDIVSCMIEKNEQPLKAGQRCVEKYGESWSSVAQCVDSDKGASILKHMGDMTHSLRPKVSFIPTVEIDGSLSEQTHIQQDLHKVLCQRFKGPKPPSC